MRRFTAKAVAVVLSLAGTFGVVAVVAASAAQADCTSKPWCDCHICPPGN